MFALTWENKDGTFDVVEFDTVDTEDHTLPNEVTEFPVEQGPDVTDNVRVKPRTLSVKGYISDTPLLQNPDVVLKADYTQHTLNLPSRIKYEQVTVDLNVPGSPIKPNVAGLVGAAFGAIFGSTPKATPLQAKGTEPMPKAVVTPLRFQAFQSRVRGTFDLLKKARTTKVLIRAITDYDEITGMAVENLSMPRTVDDGAGAVIQFDLKQITIAQSQDVTAPKPAEGLGQARKFTGSKAAKADDKAAEKARSLAKRLAGGLSGIFKDLIG
jgi:hypothetical protein